MILRSLRIDGLRCLQDVALQPEPGFNLVTGANGSGKTSLLEAIHLLSHGRSFRPGGHDALLARQRSAYSVYAELGNTERIVHRVGMAHGDDGWRLRVDGATATSLGEVIRLCASVCFEPGSHALVSGGSGERRRFLDWGVFHVEHGLLGQWQRYRKALRQRNVLLRAAAPSNQLRPWENQLLEAGTSVDTWRRAYVKALEPRIAAEMARLIPSLGTPRLSFSSGWAAGHTLGSALEVARQRDSRRGHTTVGPHRADWRLRFDDVEHHDQLSRGQEKLVALACVLAQGRCLAEQQGSWPVVCLDDLASELDREHQHRLVQRLLETQAQVWVTGTEPPAALEGSRVARFHVEHGRCRRQTASSPG